MKVLPCTRGHIPAVVELLTDQVANENADQHAVLSRYWEEIYFDNPWFDPELPSLVCEGSNGRLDGFYGVMPRPMVFNDRRLRAVAASNFWVRGEAGSVGNPLVAIKMMKKFLDGPQDLQRTARLGSPGRSGKRAAGLPCRYTALIGCDQLGRHKRSWRLPRPCVAGPRVGTFGGSPPRPISWVLEFSRGICQT